MLLYVVESAVPLLTANLVYAAMLARRKDIAGHKKWAGIHAITTWVSSILVFTLVRLGFKMGEGAPEWIMNVHLVIIWSIPPMLVILMWSGLKGIRKVHIPLMVIYSINWAAALVTGAMIFAADRGWIGG